MNENVSRLLQVTGGKNIDLAIVLGSGLSTALHERTDFARAPFAKFRGMPAATLAGHSGEILGGIWHRKRVVIFAGRVHLYQGFSAQDVTYNVRLASEAGASTLILTNAAGALNPSLAAGDIMLIKDHLNLTGHNPLVGMQLQNPFIDMLHAYDPALQSLAKEADPALREGVYASLVGPVYETPAEANYLRLIGADAVGMSTVLETIAARACKMRVLGLSLITNTVGAAETTHAEVTATAERVAPRFANIVENVVSKL